MVTLLGFLQMMQVELLLQVEQMGSLCLMARVLVVQEEQRQPLMGIQNTQEVMVLLV
jgi:hypothetical protein